MLLMTLKGIKKMLDKALPAEIDLVEGDNRLVSVQNARDMLEELIKELTEKPAPPPVDPAIIDEETCLCAVPADDEKGKCTKCQKPIDYKGRVL